MILTFEPTPEQVEFERAIRAHAERHAIVGAVSPDAWRALAGVGVLGLGTTINGGTAADAVTAARTLGWAGVQGPFVAAALAVRVLDEARAADVMSGTLWPSVAGDDVVAWSPVEDVTAVVLEAADDAVWEVELDAAQPFPTLAGEPWSRATWRRGPQLAAGSEAATAVRWADLTRAAWTVGAAERLLELAAEHARDRRQFGRAIGDFQAVAHQLASADADLGAARDLVVLSAWHVDRATGWEHDTVSAARVASTRAGLVAAATSFQVHGALGFTVERGLDRWAAAIRQISHHPPSEMTTEGMTTERMTTDRNDHRPKRRPS